MKSWVAIVAISVLGFLGVCPTQAQVDPDAPSPASQSPALKKALSDRNFFGTQPVLSLNGDYVNSPREDFEQIGKWTLPLSLEEMHGVIGELALGQAEKKGQWQLAYKWKVMTGDPEWQAISDANRDLTLSDRRTQVLKANYNVRDWWRLGVSTFAEDRFDSDGGIDAIPLGLNHQSLGFQIDTSLKF